MSRQHSSSIDLTNMMHWMAVLDRENPDSSDEESKLFPSYRQLLSRHRERARQRGIDRAKEKEEEEKTLREKKRKKTFHKNVWLEVLENRNIPKSIFDELIMNYLTIEGYQEAAKNLEEESGIISKIPIDSIQNRMEIRKCIISGKTEKAIEIVKNLYPNIWEKNPELFLHLQQQRLIEMIENGDHLEALQFAQEELVPLSANKDELADEMEEILTLLIFSDKKDFLDSGINCSQRRIKVASELNDSILEYLGEKKEPYLPQMLKMLITLQEDLEDGGIKVPKIIDLETAELKEVKSTHD